MKIEHVDSEEHLQELVDLARVEYGESEIANPDYLKWQYLSNPAGRAVVVVARAESGELAGQYIVIPLNFWLNGKKVKGSLSLNTLTHPDYRGRGLFTKMANEAYAICEREGLHLTLGFPNKNSYPGFVKKLQFKHVGNASVMFKALRPVNIMLQLPKMGSQEKYSPSSIERGSIHLDARRKSEIEMSALDLETMRNEYDDLVSGHLNAGFCVSRDAAFAQWRYHDIPTRQYSAYKATRGSEILAACVVRVRKVKGIECAFVVDLQITQAAEGLPAMKGLLQSVLSGYRNAGASIAGTMVNPGSVAHKVVKSVGFRVMPSKLLPHDAPIILRRNGEFLGTEFFDVSAWDFCFGDYDVF